MNEQTDRLINSTWLIRDDVDSIVEKHLKPPQKTVRKKVSPEGKKTNTHDNTIFVQIASYKDPELIPTLKNLTSNADVAQNIRVVVCWQHGDEQTVEGFLSSGFELQNKYVYKHTEVEGTESTFEVIKTTLNGANIELISVEFTQTRGACWARNLIQQFYNGEDYTLQLDSHHRFIKDWDSVLVEMLESIRDESGKPVLTGYIPSYDPTNDPGGRVMVPWQTNFDRFIPEGAIFFLPATMKNWEEQHRPIKTRFYSGHFAFADGSFAEEVQHDPQYFFHGEEISIAVRAFTHGYDLYTPHRLIAWHEYTRKGRTKVWDDHTTEAKKTKGLEKDWVERNNLCHKRNRILFGMDGEDPNQIDFGKYGFGKKRSLTDYEKYAGVSFKLRGVQQYTLDGYEPPNPEFFDNEEELRNSFLTSVDIRICVHKTEFGDLPNDIDFCFVGVHDVNGLELHRKDMTKEEFKNRMESAGEWIDYQYICIIDQIPYSYTLWPHTKNGVWLKKITKSVK